MLRHPPQTSSALAGRRLWSRPQWGVRRVSHGLLVVAVACQLRRGAEIVDGYCWPARQPGAVGAVGVNGRVLDGRVLNARLATVRSEVLS